MIATAQVEIVDAACAQIDRIARERIDARTVDAEGIPPTLLDALAEMGLLGLTLPVEDGGSGVDLGGACAVVRRLAGHDRSVAVTIGLHLGLGTRGLVAFGTPEQRAAFLPGAARADLAAFAATEPDAGSDLSAIGTRAVPHGDGFVVDGSKAFVTNGGWASVFTVLCATPYLGGRRAGQALVLVRRDDAGVSTGPEERKLGLRGSSTTPLYLDGVRIGPERILGDAGDAPRQLEHVLGWGRTLMSAGCLGTADAALEAIVRHVTRRRQFRRSLAELQVVREQIAAAAAQRVTMEALVARAAEDPRGLTALAAKVLCSEGAWALADLAVQLHGGLGFIEESGVPLLLRDARITRIFEGANDVLLVHAGAIEATAAGGGGPLGAEVTELRRGLVGALGAGLLRRPDALHRLGRAALLREAAAAVEGPGDLREHAVLRLRGELAACRHAPEPVRVAAIAERCCAEVSP